MRPTIIKLGPRLGKAGRRARGQGHASTIGPARSFPAPSATTGSMCPSSTTARPACVMVFQDGGNYVDPKKDFRVPIVFDNLIHKKEMPVTIGIFINPGVVPAATAEREAAAEPQLRVRHAQPAVRRLPGQGNPAGGGQEVQAHERGRGAGHLRHQLGRHLRLDRRPGNGPTLFARCSATSAASPNIRGGHVYPALIRKTERKPIRVFLQDGSGDLDNLHGNWPLANQQMAAALKFADYDYQFDYGDGGHNGKHGGAILPDRCAGCGKTCRPWRRSDSHAATVPARGGTSWIGADPTL